MHFGYCNTAQFLTHVYLGATIVILGGIFFPKSFLETVQQEAVTNFTCVPAALLLLLQYRFASQYDVSSCLLYTSSSQASVMQEMPVNLTVPLQGNDGLQESIGAVQQILGGKTAAYQTEDLTQATKVMEQNMQILWFVVGVTIGLSLIHI